VQWLEIVLLVESSGAFLLAGLNSAWLTRLALTAHARARRVGASALALVCGGMALEALLYTAMAPPPQSELAKVATLVVRSALLLSGTVVTALILRNGSTRR
jgi:hypothetical protein